MKSIHEELRKSIETGFIDKNYSSHNLYLPQLVTNNRLKNKKVLPVILNELRNCDEFYFSVAFLTKSGVAVLINTLEELRNKGIKGKILVSQYQNFTQPEALKTLLQFENIELRIATKGNFHAKGYFFRHGNHYSLMVGSSNLTASALCTNKEWNLMVTAWDNSSLVTEVLEEADSEFAVGYLVTPEYIKIYEDIYNQQREMRYKSKEKLEKMLNRIEPNKMQREALINIENLRKTGENRGLLISATGTGKTYLSAFDVKEFNPKRFLFIVHRRNIAKKAMESYKTIFGSDKSMGLFSGEEKDIKADFIFSTVQTISKKSNLGLFSKDHFDYIVIDETHRASAPTYQKILNYFTPKFLLGMTATPERTDGFDIFNQFNHNIAYEIRLNGALEEKMLVPFHYYGVTDIQIEDSSMSEEDNFSKLISKERVEKIIEKSKFYGADEKTIRGLIFCSRKKESQELSRLFNEKGYRTIALTGESSQNEREKAIKKLESDGTERLDYIFTVDIFNEGIDIPKVNQIIMVRPTQSAIIFIQQLGRGLRKSYGKEYLTVIDFIGNYSNNYLIPIALYGDNSFDKSKIKKMLVNESILIPGSSTINFDKISKERIFKALDLANLKTRKDLIKDYELLKYKLGKIPMMKDFIEMNSRDPKTYVDYSKSYYNFILTQERDLISPMDEREKKLLEFFSTDIANLKRIEEVLVMSFIIESNNCGVGELKDEILKKYGYELSDETIGSIYKNLNFEFITEKHEKKLITVREKYGFNIIKLEDNIFSLEDDFIKSLENKTFKTFLLDLLKYSRIEYDKNYKKENFYDGFNLYEKYSRKDVIRVLNWRKNEVAQGIAGYKVNEKLKNCPVFITYHGDEQIYDHGFLSRSEFKWMSKARRKLTSPDMTVIRNQKIRMPLFVKKSDDEGIEFFYMGDLTPKKDGIKEMRIVDKKGKDVSVVGIECNLNRNVEDEMYRYLMEE
ncbi:MAG: DEAD/DEAH box helicase [Psychrilyobacter sp.]|uniref:DEAD/DEAH box helicase n=1 Tax=Psychrilyobacter sp. TaxID=2586924 RepID=UPI003C777559